MENYTIMLPVNSNNLPFANKAIKHLIENTEIKIIVVDDNGQDDFYIQHPNVSFIHVISEKRRPLVQIWNQCIKDCPTENVIIASWRQRPNKSHFDTINEKLNDGYGLVAFDELHFFAFNKYLTTIVGFFDEGFEGGQYEDTDFWNRLKTNNIGIYVGDMPEERNFNGSTITSTWVDLGIINKTYYDTKWFEDRENGQLIQFKEEKNIDERNYYKGKYNAKSYKPWSDSVLFSNLKNYFILFKNHVKKFE
jgi:hypothetical protein